MNGHGRHQRGFGDGPAEPTSGTGDGRWDPENGVYGNGLIGVKQNAKTKAWWSSINTVEVSARYTKRPTAEPYLVNFWIVRPNDAAAPDLLRFSVNSWRQGQVTVGGVTALVAAMDDNDAVWNQNDMWSVLENTAPDAPKAVLSITEAKATSRLMFVKDTRVQNLSTGQTLTRTVAIHVTM